MDDVNQLAGAAARLLQPVMGDPGAAASGAGMSGAPAEALRGVPAARAIRVAARDGARASRSTRRAVRPRRGGPRVRARNLGAARRLAAHRYRALANVNLLRALLPAEGPASRSRLARRLLLAALELGPDASPAQTAAEGARHRRRAPRRPPRFHLRRRPGRRGRRGRRRGSAAPRGCRPLEPERVVVSRRLFRREPPSRRNRPALGEGGGAGGGRRGGVHCSASPRTSWRRVGGSFAKFAPELVRRVVEGGRGSAAATRLLSAALDPPPNASGSFAASFKEREILDAFARHAPSLASLVREGGGPGDLATARDAGATPPPPGEDSDSAHVRRARVRRPRR